MQETKLQVELELQEINALLQILGDMPTKSGVWNLMLKIQEQAKSQLEAKS